MVIRERCGRPVTCQANVLTTVFYSRELWSDHWPDSTPSTNPTIVGGWGVGAEYHYVTSTGSFSSLENGSSLSGTAPIRSDPVWRRHTPFDCALRWGRRRQTDPIRYERTVESKGGLLSVCAS
eukprot:sb/3475860/